MDAAARKPAHDGGSAGGSGASLHAALLLGIALGGFFDGILLHQLLQWHHLLSGLEGEVWRDIRVQILADGLFHLLMYVLAAIGLYLLWRNRGDAAARSGASLFGSLLVGVGLWNIADIGLFHWIVGIHRVRMEVENPLLWDLLWFAVFGLGVGGAGIWLRSRTGSSPGGGRRPLAAMMLAGIVAAAAVFASLPVRDAATDSRSPLLVYFLPGASPADIFAAVDSLGGRTMWSDPSGQVYLLDAPDDAGAWQLYRFRALPVSSTVSPAACFRAMRLI